MSLYYSADVISEKGEIFRIKSNGKEIQFFPSDSCNFKTFMEFYRFIVEQIDPDAKVIENQELSDSSQIVEDRSE